MPQLIEYIDKIARDKKRDVLLLTFHDQAFKDAGDTVMFPRYDYSKSKPRKKVMDWLTANNIQFSPCGSVATENSMVPYLGQLYIDVPFDETDPIYQKVSDFLENPDGTMKIEGVCFNYCPLELAMENAHHDEPGFREKWAQDF